MRAREVTALATLILAAMIAGCVAGLQPQPPAGWARAAADEARKPSGYGMWCALMLRSDPKWVEGELISVEGDSVLVLAGGGLVARGIKDLRRAAVVLDYTSSASEWYTGEWGRLRPFARFPGGVPAAVDARALLPKP